MDPPEFGWELRGGSMKRKLAENTIPKIPENTGQVITAQLAGDILIINLFRNKVLKGKHCINKNTLEYKQYIVGQQKWAFRKFANLAGCDPIYCGVYDVIKKTKADTKEDEELIREALCGVSSRQESGIFHVIDWAEDRYNETMRDEREKRRRNKVQAVMDRIPDEPQDLCEWIDRMETASKDYILQDKKKKSWTCSACGHWFRLDAVKRDDGGDKVRHNDIVICPACQKRVQIKKRNKSIEVRTHFAVLQPVDDEISVARHYDAVIYCRAGMRKDIELSEAMRIVLYKKDPKMSCNIYYNQYSTCYSMKSYFDDKGNPANRRTTAEYLYPEGIREALEHTRYAPWTRLFMQMSQAGQKLHYNHMMACCDRGIINLTELLFKGRFYKLLLETTQDLTLWGTYYGILRLSGESIEDVFDIGDRQLINRIRDKNGGKDMVRWMQWSERNRAKISDKALEWLLKNHITKKDLQWVPTRMTLEKAMNYFERQRKESYKGKSVKTVISQYEDYMRMCERLHKDTSDEMVYKPRELKRRHDEAVAMIAEREAELQAEEYSKKYAEAENVLRRIKEKYEYAGETYFITVPDRIVDIVKEGRYLHHCAGATDRYFDRIKQKETYICFLRKTKEPEIPFYTIEVEPGGTIRQHRGMFDEEPDIESVKPFLKEWQQVIKKRMSREDHQLAAISKVKREENLEELRQKNNTRVLKGLMEDFMEAV